MSRGIYHWSRIAQPARFWKINAAAALPWVALALHARWWIFGVALLWTLASVYIEVVKKTTLTAFFRGVLLAITGKKKSTTNIVKQFLS